MQSRRIWTIGAIVGTVVVLLLAVGGQWFTPYLSPGGGGFMVIAFAGGPGSDTASIYQNLATNASQVTYLAPYWYKVNADGSVTASVDQQLLALARRYNVKVAPLFTNGRGNETFLLQPTVRSRAVANISAIVRSNNYAGASIDFELLRPDARVGLVSFTTQLVRSLHAMRKMVSVDVVPEGHSNLSRGAYDYHSLATVADAVVLMTYDEHDDTSSAGPVAGIDWVTRRLQEALGAGVPADKLVLGIADYGYDWSGSGHAPTVAERDVPGIATAHHAAIVWSSADQEPHLTYTSGGATHQIWFENSKAVGIRVALARRQRLAGVALWRMGYEDQAVWDAIKQNR